jgi:hypothetical protein
MSTTDTDAESTISTQLSALTASISELVLQVKRSADQQSKQMAELCGKLDGLMLSPGSVDPNSSASERMKFAPPDVGKIDCPSDKSKTNDTTYNLKAKYFPEFLGGTEITNDINFWLYQVEEMSAGKLTLSDYKLVAYDRFKAEAKKKLERHLSDLNDCSTWDQFKKVLRKLFADSDYKAKLFNELAARKPGPHESLEDYWSTMAYLRVNAEKLGMTEGVDPNLSRYHFIKSVIKRLPLPVMGTIRQLWQSQLNGAKKVNLLEFAEILSDPVVKLMDQETRLKPQRIKTQESKKSRCVCGGEHLYRDCPLPIGKKKWAEIKDKVKKRYPEKTKGFVKSSGNIYSIAEFYESDSDPETTIHPLTESDSDSDFH